MTKKQDKGYNYIQAHIFEQEDISQSVLIITQQSIESLFEFIDDDEMTSTQINRIEESLTEILEQDIPSVFSELGRKIKFDEPISTESRYYEAYNQTIVLYDDFQAICIEIQAYIEEQTPKLDSVLADNQLVVTVLYDLTEMVVSLGKQVVEAKHAVDEAIASIKKDNRQKALIESKNARVNKAMADHYEQRRIQEEEAKEKEAYEKAAEKRKEAEQERLELLALERDLRVKQELLKAKKAALKAKKLRGE